MLTTVTSWLWIDIHRQIGVLYTAFTTILNYFVPSHFFFSDIQPIKERGKQQVCLCHQYINIYIYRSNIEQSIHIQSQTHTHTHTHTHTVYSKLTQTNTYFRKIFEGFVSNNGHDRFSNPPPPPPPQVVPLWVVPNNQANSSFLHRVPPVRGGGGGGGVGGGVMIPTNSRKSFKEKYMANKRERIWRRDSSMLFLCEQQRTHANGT